MSIKFKSNFPKIAASLKKKIFSNLQAVAKGMIVGMRQFESFLIKTQMTGQRGDIFLNRITGNLARSWFVESDAIPNIAGRIVDFKVNLATDVKYAAKHQFSTDHQRLFAFEAFLQEGPGIISKPVARFLSGV